MDSYNFTLQDLKKQNARLMIQLRSLKAQLEGGSDIVKGGRGSRGVSEHGEEFQVAVAELKVSTG